MFIYYYNWDIFFSYKYTNNIVITVYLILRYFVFKILLGKLFKKKTKTIYYLYLTRPICVPILNIIIVLNKLVFL